MSASVREITSATELRELLGEPTPRSLVKERPRLHARDRDWLAASPFCLVATADAEGNCDVSPKGDPPGFTLVLDDSTIAIPERIGNRRADGFHNILHNPHVGLIYLIPGRDDTLRINGRATLIRDAPWFDQLIVKGHRPQLAVVVAIDTIFLHCAKAFMRSALWQPETWKSDALPRQGAIVKSLHPDLPGTVEEIEAAYAARCAQTLYG